MQNIIGQNDLDSSLSRVGEAVRAVLDRFSARSFVVKTGLMYLRVAGKLELLVEMVRQKGVLEKIPTDKLKMFREYLGKMIEDYSQITENFENIREIPRFMFRRPRHAINSVNALLEDMIDICEAREAIAETEKEGSIPFDQAMAEIGL